MLAAAMAATRDARADCGRAEPAVFAWVMNDGSHGQSPDARMDAVVSLVLADVQRVRFTAADVYVEATGIPRYPVGPFPDGNPNIPQDQSYGWRFPRAPQPNPGAPTATGLGPVGAWVNGVAIFNAKDAMSWNGQNVWHQNAVVAEADGFDAALGHAEMRGRYHHHQQPIALLAQLGDDGSRHSSIVGFAFDGYPVYGPWGFASPDGTGGVVRIRSSWRQRAITTRDTLPDGTSLPAAQQGPAVSATHPLGTYVEDFEYVAGLGDLDEDNGRFGVTPEYPLGTYAYFTTIDAAGESAYPYCIGPTYHGTLVQDDVRQTVSVPGGTCTWSGACVEGDCPQSCSDGIDDDEDNLIDCLDPDCSADPDCASADGDGDGAPDVSDCAPADGSAFAVPGEPLDVRVARSAGEAELSWGDLAAFAGTGTTYDVASDTIARLRADRIVAAPCVQQGIPAPSFADATPAAAEGLYWLVRGVNACGPPAGSGWGSGSDGTPHAACP
jgi:hypothetical protein